MIIINMEILIMTVKKQIFINGKKYKLFRAYKYKKNILNQKAIFQKNLIKVRIIKKNDSRPYKLYYRNVIDK